MGHGKLMRFSDNLSETGPRKRQLLLHPQSLARSLFDSLIAFELAEYYVTFLVYSMNCFQGDLHMKIQICPDSSIKALH